MKRKEMKMILSVLFGSLVLISLFSSCEKETLIGEGPVVTETRPLTNFRGVSSGMPGKINFKIDPVYKVEIKAQQNIINEMRTDIIDGIIQIDFRRNIRLRGHDDIIVNISGPSAEFLRVSGTGDINVEGNVVANNMDINISGSANISVEKVTIADKIDARISGSGNVKITSGTAKNEELRISGSGGMDLSNVPAEKADTHISGSGDIKVNLSQKLDAKISGSGSVYYKGNPVVTTSISGSGTVRPL